MVKIQNNMLSNEDNELAARLSGEFVCEEKNSLDISKPKTHFVSFLRRVVEGLGEVPGTGKFPALRDGVLLTTENKFDKYMTIWIVELALR